MNRRNTLKGLAGAGVSVLAATRARAASSRASLNLDLTKPADNVYAMVKIQGDASGRTTCTWGQGQIFGVRDNELAVPMLRFQSGRIGAHRRRNDGSYEFRFRGMILYQDFETGEFIDTYVNPYNGKECTVRNFRTNAGYYYLTEKGTLPPEEFVGESAHLHADGYVLQWERAGEYAYVTSDERIKYLRRSDNAWRVDNALLRYEVNWADLNDPNLTSVEASTSWQTQIQWFEWLDMGDLPGMHMQGGNGRKFLSTDQLPERFVARAESLFPGSITDPITWEY